MLEGKILVIYAQDTQLPQAPAEHGFLWSWPRPHPFMDVDLGREEGSCAGVVPVCALANSF